MFYSIEDIKSRNRARGHHFFEPGTMRFFRSRVLSGVEAGRFFITSERFVASDGSSPGRRYTVRYAEDDGNVETAGEFQQFRTARSARKEVRRLGREFITGRATAPTANGKDLEIFETWTRFYRQNP